MNSRWYAHSRSVLADTLDALSKDSSKADIEAAVHAAYPYGQRAMHPYKQWCKAKADILGERYPQFFASPKAIYDRIYAKAETGILRVVLLDDLVHDGYHRKTAEKAVNKLISQRKLVETDGIIAYPKRSNLFDSV